MSDITVAPDMQKSFYVNCRNKFGAVPSLQALGHVLPTDYNKTILAVSIDFTTSSL